MSLTLLEKQGTIQYPKSGALLHYHALGRQSGRLYGCNLVQATSETIVLTSGVLVIRGYRIEVIDETVFDSTKVVPPSTPMRYYLILRLDAGIEDTENELIVTDVAPVNDTPIESQSGVYDYLLGVFNFGPGGISEFTSLIETIDTTKTSGSGAGTVVQATWFDGNVVDGTNTPIFCVVDAVTDVQVGAYYLNNTNGNYYKCIDISSGLAFWEYRGNMRGPEGDAGSIEIGTNIASATNNNKPAGELAVKDYVATVIGGLAELLEEV